jgi:hypothetical protein
MSYRQLTQGQCYQIYAMFIIGYNQTVMAKGIVSQKSTNSKELEWISGWRGYRLRRDHFLGQLGEPGGIRTLDLFRAIDEQVGKKRKKVVYYVYYVTESPYCANISVPELFPGCSRSMKRGKATRKPVQMGIWCEWCPWKTSSLLFSFVPLIQKPVLVTILIHRIS